MKKLYRNRGTVHPSPPHISDKLSYLPAAILTLTAALTADDREVLAYLLSCSSSAAFAATWSGTHPKKNNADPNSPSSSAAATGRTGCIEADEHPATFSCNCFRCYMSFWIRWDSSPNRHLIHEIIDAFEDWLAGRKSRKGGKRDRRKKCGLGGSAAPDGETKQVGVGERNGCASELSFGEVDELTRSTEPVVVAEDGGGGVEDEDCGGDREEDEDEGEKGPLGKLVSFIGEKIWGVWGRGELVG